MIPGFTEIAAVLSPLFGAGAVLFFMRRDRAGLDARLDEMKLSQQKSSEDACRRLERIEANQQRFELALKDVVPWEEWRKMEQRVDGVDLRLTAIETACKHNHNGGKP